MKATLRVILSVALAVPFVAIAACDETIPITPAPPSSADAGSDSSTAADAAAGPGLFQRLGGEPGIRQFVDAVIAAEAADPVIGTYFAPNMAATPPNGKPTVTQIKECLVKQIANAAGGKDAAGNTIAYPTTVSGGYQCRDMTSSHATLRIGSGIFDKFATIALTVAKGAGLSDADLQTVGGFLQLQKDAVVDETAPDGPFDAGTTPADSGSDAPADAPADGG